MSEHDHSTSVVFGEIPNAPGYRISNMGFVESSRLTRGRSWMRMKVHNKNKVPSIRKQYLACTIIYKGKRKTFNIHRLVLEAFRGPCPPGMEGCHNNGDTFDNRLENLRWDTRKNNHADKKKHGTHLEGSSIFGSRLNETIVEEIISMLDAGRTGREIRERFDVSPKLLNKIARKTHWKHVRPDRSVMNVPKPIGYHISPNCKRYAMRPK